MIFCDLPTITDEPQKFYRYTSRRLAQWNRSNTTVSLGVSGRF